MLTTGDNAYTIGSVENFDEFVFDVYHDLMRTAAFFPAIGNHDVTISGIVNFSESFVLPANNVLAQETFYSFDLGAAHFVYLDSTASEEGSFALTDGAGGQILWLRNVLASTNQPWKIVYLHPPVYLTCNRNDAPCTCLCESEACNCSRPKSANWSLLPVLEPLFNESSVDLVLAGDDHMYYRTHPILDGVVRDSWHGKRDFGGEDVYHPPPRNDLRRHRWRRAIHRVVPVRAYSLHDGDLG